MTLFLAICFMLLLSTGIAYARSMADQERKVYMETDSPMDKKPELISVSKGGNEAHGAGETSGYSIILDGSDWLLNDDGLNNWSKAYTVSVPSSISGALYKAGVIKDPTVGRNDAAAKALGEKNWYCKKTFNYSGTGKNVYLCFDGVADRIDVYLNGKKVGSHQGMFGGPYIDVTDVIKQGSNDLVVHLKPVINYTKTVVFNCSYAWHYADLPPIGIWNSVRVEDRSSAELDDPFITTVSHETGTMDMSIDITDVSGSGAKIGGTIYCTITPKNFSGSQYSFAYVLPEAQEGGDRNVRLRFDLPEFKLWWPNGYGEQNLYTLETLFVDSTGGRSYARSDFGVRTLEFIATGRKETANMYNRTAVFNGKTVFLKGADWCTIDAVMNFTREDYDRILCRARDQGLNVFRSWGGGMCETDDFYDLCDEYGLCVYQEWPCCWDSQKTQPEDVLYETVILNTKRIRNRASLLVYGGGNEGEAVISDKVMNNIGMLTYKYDGTRDFWRQDGGVGANGIIHDHIHWGGETPEHYAEVYYNTDRNFHEYGLDSMMNLESIARYATEEEMAEWPIDPAGTIAYHTATFNGMKGWNMTPYGYDIDTFIHYASQFVEVTDLESLVTGTQFAQTMADYLAALNSRINFPNQSMVMVYKFNDVYPGASWSIVDYYGSPKMAYWFLQDAYAPLTAGLKADRYDTYNKTVKSINFPVYVLDDADELAGSDWSVTVRAYDSMLNTVKESSYSGSGSIDMTKNIGEFTLSAKQTETAPLFIVTSIYKNGSLEARTYMFMNSGKDPGCLFAVPAANVDYTVSGNTITVKNSSDIPAIAVNFDVGSASDTFRPDDNYFWLEPGETYTFSVSDASVIKGIKGFNLCDQSDKNAPKAPEGIKAASSDYCSVDLSWKKPANDENIRFYELYLNGYMLCTIKGSATEYKIEGLGELSTYEIKLIAVDQGMNKSGLSKAVKVTTNADNIAPKAIKFELKTPDTGIVTFSRKVDKESAENTDYYILNLGGEVTEARALDDEYSVELKFKGLDGDLAGRTLTVMGVCDQSASKNHAERTCFDLRYSMVGHWTFDNKKSVTDESLYHSEEAKIDGAEFEEGISGFGIRPVRSELVLAQTDFNLKDSVISFWVKTGEFGDFNVFLSKGEKVSGHFEIYTNMGQLKLYITDVCDNSFNIDMKKYSGEWIHMCFVCDGSTMSCYINGVKEGSVKITKELKNFDFKLYLGSLPGGQFRTDGVFDELILLRTSEGEDLVKDLYEKTLIREIKCEKSSYKIKTGNASVIKLIRENVDDSVPVTWTSSDESIATVDQNGNVTTIADGTVLITVQTEDGRYIDKCVVSVGDYKEEKIKNNSVITIIAIILACVAVAAIAFIVILAVKRKKKNS